MKSISMKLVASVAMLLAVMSPTFAITVTWDGGGNGTGTFWETAENWVNDVKPAPMDTTAFTNTGLSASKVITLDAPQTIDTLSLDTTLNFTIDNAAGNTAGHTLSFANFNRSIVRLAGPDRILLEPSPWHLIVWPNWETGLS